MATITLKQAAAWCGGTVEEKYENVDVEKIELLHKEFNFSKNLAKILVGRGIDSVEKVKKFLEMEKYNFSSDEETEQIKEICVAKLCEVLGISCVVNYKNRMFVIILYMRSFSQKRYKIYVY